VPKKAGESEGKTLLDAMRDGALDGMQHFERARKAGACRHRPYAVRRERVNRIVLTGSSRRARHD